MMTSLPHASGFRDLLAYQKARELTGTIYGLTASFPKEEMYSLTDQIHRSSRSIGANLAEAWAKRRYEKHFWIMSLRDGVLPSKQSPVQEDCFANYARNDTMDSGYWTNENAAILRQKCEEIGRLLGGMMAKAEMFCGDGSRVLRESSAEYFTSSEQ